MKDIRIFLCLCMSWLCGIYACKTNRNSITNDDNWPIVVVAMIIRDNAFALPLFFTYFERLNYPKQRMVLWIRSNENSDNSEMLLELWLNHTSTLYRQVDYQLECNNQTYNKNKSQREKLNIFNAFLKEAALKFARDIKADYVFFLDGTGFLTYANTLNYLISLDLPVVAPMLSSNDFIQYVLSKNTTNLPVYTQRVSFITQAMLVNIKHKEMLYLTFNRERFILLQQQRADEKCFEYGIPIIDFAIFGASASCLQIPMYVSHKYNFGHMIIPSIYGANLEENLMELQNIRVQMHYDNEGMPPIIDYFQEYMFYPKKTKLTLDHIYIINLAHRHKRRATMEKVFNELGLDVEFVKAVDGRNLSLNNLKKCNISLMVDDVHPVNGDRLTYGEIGCFISHYNIWQKIVELQQKRVLILEDDLYFLHNFKQKAVEALKEAESLADYDLLYLARKPLTTEREPWLKGNEWIQYVGYSHWTYAYIITLRGAEKLIAAKPLEKLIVLDEFLPIMSKCHPDKTMRDAFPLRNLIALSVKENLIGTYGKDSDTCSSNRVSQ